MGTNWEEILIQKNEVIWDIPKEIFSGMMVDGRIYASIGLINQIVQDQSLQQVVNVAFLPGIVGYSLAMPDIHWGYGFPIGGVAATRVEDGVISPGGVGFDINCGVRLIRSNLFINDLKSKLETLLELLYKKIPSGVGAEGNLKLTPSELKQVLAEGAQWVIKKGYGEKDDFLFSEEKGKMIHANPEIISKKALQRSATQLGTLGSGNHFLEIQIVDKIYQPKIAQSFGLEKDMVVIAIHTGSRGFGHQVCTDYLSKMQKAVQKYHLSLPDKQLACAPINSPEGLEYYQAMCCAANFAWANRQYITYWIREIFENVFRMTADQIGLNLVYDVAHNIAKKEMHRFAGKEMQLCVHRKGATRAFPPDHPDLPAKYQQAGQPVLVPGDMGRYSYCLAGKKEAMENTFGSACHGAGRILSRGAAKKETEGRNISAELKEKNILVKARNRNTLREEFPAAYKDVSEVVKVIEVSNICEKVARMRPLGVIKG